MIVDNTLLNRLRAGEAEAWEVIVTEFEGPLYRYFFFQQRNHHVAQDHTAETFAQLVRSLPNMRGSGDQFRAFLFGIARHVQQRGWRKSRTAETSLVEAQEIIDQRPRPGRQIVEREELQRVSCAIQGLDESVRSVILLRFVEGLSLREIAEVLDCPVGTIKSHIHRGLSRLKKMIREEECEV